MKISFEKKADPTVVDGMKISDGAGKRAAQRLRWLLVLAIVSSPLLYFVFSVSYNILVVVVPGQVRMTTYTVVSPVTGVLQNFSHAPGGMLATQQPIGNLNSLAHEEKIASLEARKEFLAEQQAQTQQVEASQKKLLASTRQSLSALSAELAQIKALMSRGAATQTEYTAARLRLEARQMELTQLEKTLLFTGGDIELKRTQVEIDALRAEFNQTHALKTPRAGQIIKKHVVDGQFVMQGTPLLEIALPETASFEIYVLPKHYDRIRLGEELTLAFSDGKKVKGWVSGLSLTAEKRPASLDTQMSTNQVVMPVTLNIEEPIENLTYGAPFNVRLRGIF